MRIFKEGSASFFNIEFLYVLQNNLFCFLMQKAFISAFLFICSLVFLYFYYPVFLNLCLQLTQMYFTNDSALTWVEWVDKERYTDVSLPK